MLDNIYDNFVELVESLYIISSFTTLSNNENEETIKYLYTLLNEYHGIVCTEFDEMISNLLKDINTKLNNIKNYLYTSNTQNIELNYNLTLSNLINTISKYLSNIYVIDYNIDIIQYYDDNLQNITNDISAMSNQTTKISLVKAYSNYNSVYKYALNQREIIYSSLKDCVDYTQRTIAFKINSGQYNYSETTELILKTIIFITKSYIILYMIYNEFLSQIYEDLSNIKLL